MSNPIRLRQVILLLSLGFFISGYFFCSPQLRSRSRPAFLNGVSNPVYIPENNTHYNHNGSSLNATKHFVTSQLENHHDVSQFVSFHQFIYEGRRLGNQIFNFAAVVFAAELTGRRPVLKSSTKILLLEQVFQLNLERIDDLCPCYIIGEMRHLTYDQNIESEVLNAANKSILINGYRQSWKYTMTIEHRLRQYLVFKDEIRRVAEEFLRRNIPIGWKRAGFVRIGIHVRRGDNSNESALKYGYTVATATYFEKAMQFFIKRFNRIQFIAMSDDRNWTLQSVVIPKNLSSSVSVNITYSVDHSAGQDLAILSLCDHVIMSTGTFGWWGAWLAKGTTIYYKDWPRPGSTLFGHFKREDFFPPSWIPLSS